MCWQSMAFQRRARNDISDYNKAQLEVITILQRVPGLLEELQGSVTQKIDDLKEARKMV